MEGKTVHQKQKQNQNQKKKPIRHRSFSDNETYK